MQRLNLCVELHEWVTARFKGDEIRKQLNADGAEETESSKITTYIVDLLPSHEDHLDDVVISLVDHSVNNTQMVQMDQVHFSYPHEIVDNQYAELSNKFLEIQKQHSSFSNYIWNYVDHQPILNNWNTSEEVPSRTDLLDTICADMKNRGFTFIGSKIIYAFMQAIGMVNDQPSYCFRHHKNNI